MCSTCGCEDREHEHEHDGEHKHSHDHSHGREINLIKVEQAALAENERFAAYNRGYFAGRKIRALNLISSPGSGKTTLLEKTLTVLQKRGKKCAVIEGDQHTDNDAKRIAATGAPVKQINVGKACHLDAHQVGHALEHLPLENDSLLFIENVGNLICPTEFNLGERERVVILSVTEGADKPAKYPLAFSTATVVIFSKIDLLPYVDFDIEESLRLVKGLSPKAQIFQLSAKTGEGMEEWINWLL